jgi:uncharacterized protein YbaR (Trm112 family)
MKEHALQVLSCPDCRGALGLKAEQRDGDEVVSGSLECLKCRRVFRVEEGVPRFVNEREPDRTIRNFSAQWRLRSSGSFENDDLLYGHDTLSLTRWLFRNCLGEVAAGEWMLDAGCGSGEKAAQAAREHPSLQVIALDASEAVAHCARRWAHLANLLFVQADVRRPPLREAAFAKVLSWGVLHHTTSTRGSFETLSRLVSPGGRMAVWLYPHPAEDGLFAKYYWVRDSHFLGRGHRLPPRLRFWLVLLYCALTFPLLLIVCSYEASRRYAGKDYMRLNELPLALKFKTLAFILYDNISPEYQHRHRREEVLGWFGA